MSTRYVWGKYSTKTIGAIPKYLGHGVDYTFQVWRYGDEDDRNYLYGPLILLSEEPKINKSATSRATAYILPIETISEFNNNRTYEIPAGNYYVKNECFNDGKGNYCNSEYGYAIEPLTATYRGLSNGKHSFAYHGESVNEWGADNLYGKDQFLNNVSSNRSGAYSSNNTNFYEYKGTDNIDPTNISITGNIAINNSITIKITPSSSNVYGGTITYEYSVKINDAWSTITSSTNTSVTYTIPTNATNIQFRVRSSDDMGFTSKDYVFSTLYNLNVAPVISGSNSNLGTFTYNPPYISYIITDTNNDTVTVTVKLDNSTLETRTVTLGQTYTVSLDWWDIGTGTHTVTITANDGQGGTATRTYTFTKNSVGQISFNRLHKKTSTEYQTTYIETDSDSIITNNGQVLSERLESIASRLSISISTTPTEMVSRHRLHIKLTSEYTIDYLEMYSTNVKVGSSTLEEVLVQLETKVGISNGGTVPSNLNFERWRMKNSSGGYDIIYLEGVSEHIICPCGKSVEERLVAIEAKI